jgi:hypothetical protein
MKTIDVCMTSWPNHPERIKYTKHIFKSLEHLFGGLHFLRFYMSAETQRDPKHSWHGEELSELCEKRHVELQWRAGPANLGANMNAAMRMGEGEFILLQQDDWLLLEPLDLSPGADLLEKHKAIDIVRYCWPDNDRMRPTYNGELDGWRTIDPKGKWPYGDDPHLRRRDFMEKWKWYLEGGGHGSASGDLMRLMANSNALSVVADKVYYAHHGRVSAVINGPRDREKRRDECLKQ